MPTKRRTLLLSAALLAASAPASALQDGGGSWPHWRGPNRDAISTESDWSPEGAAEPLWALDVGLGYSCVSIADGSLYTLGFDEAGETDRLFCLDPKTGEERWRHEWPAKVHANFHGGGTLTTPSILGERLYVINRFGLGLCLDRTSGEVVWERDYAEELELELTFHGFSASPMLIDGGLFLVFGDVLVRCDPANGDVVWRVGSPGDGGYSNLSPFEWNGRPVFAMYAGTGLVIYDRENGDEHARFAWKPTGGGVNCCTPIVVGDRVFISSAYNLGSAYLLLVDGAEPELLWMDKMFRNKVCSCVLFEGHIYGFDGSMLKCIDLEGREKWRVRGLGMGTPALAGGKLLVLSSKGDLIIAEASPEGFEPLSKRRVLEEGVYWTPPVLLDGLIYCRNSLGRLVCLDHRTGAAGASVAASTDAPDAEAPAAEALFARHVELTGGELRRARKSVHLEGEIEITGAGITRSPMEIRRMAPDLWHLQYSLGPYGTVQRGFDGTVGWVLDPFYGNELVEGDALLEMKQTLPFLHGIDWRGEYDSLAAPMRASFGNRDCWEVAAVTKGGTQRKVYFDVETGRLVGRNAPTEALIVHSDWRVFDGVELPGKTTRLIPDTGAEETYFVTKATWDTVALDAFEYPPEVVKMLRTPEEVEADARRLREAYGTYFGSYRKDGGDSVWRFHADAGELTVDTPDQGPFTLSEPDADGRFTLPYPGMWVVFETDAEGDVTGLVFHGPQGEQRLLRQED
jgi:outer membrane protein assembly factor BamB